MEEGGQMNQGGEEEFKAGEVDFDKIPLEKQ